MRVLIALAFCSLLACAETSNARTVLIHTRDEQRPLPAVPVEIDGTIVGKTDAAGDARFVLPPGAAPRVRLAVACPQGSRDPGPRHVARTVEGGSPRVELTFVCRPRQRLLAIVVRAPGAAGTVLRVDGEPMGTVDEEGVLHAAVWREPDSELQLMLDATASPRAPAQPLREHRTTDRDELVVFDQPSPPRARRAHPKRAGRAMVVAHPFGGRR